MELKSLTEQKSLLATLPPGKRARLHRLLFAGPNPIPVKWALHLLGMFGPEIRLPLVQLGEPGRIALATELRRLGLLS